MASAITIEQAQQILNQYHDHDKLTVLDVKDLPNTGFSYSASQSTLLLSLSSDGRENTHSSFLTISRDTPQGDEYHPNSLRLVSALIEQIAMKTSLPISASTLDTSQSIIPYHFLFTAPYPLVFKSQNVFSLAYARANGMLSDRHLALVDMQIGVYLAQVHRNVQNDWFGLPALSEPADPSYSWQETFTHSLETLLSSTTVNIADILSVEALQAVRLALSRAIGFFLFDDADTPSLIWLTGSEHDIYLDVSAEIPAIAAVLPNLSHAIWGDPLLETFFLPGASEALLEGYARAGGSPLIIFPRQKTKRLWYSLFLALLLLQEKNAERKEWAIETIKKSAEELKTAPCY